MVKRLLALLILAVGLAAAGYGWDFRLFLRTPVSVPETGYVFELTPGTSLRKLATELEQRGVVSSALYLQLLARWKGQAGRLQAGEYRIAPQTPPESLLRQLVEGRVLSYSITLVEGWSFRQVLEALEKHETITQTLGELTVEQIMERLGKEGEHAEGRFYPDTYQFPRGTTDLAILQRAYATMEETLADEWSRREEGLPLKNPYEALVLASIVERETGLASERPEIAGVFTRRLRKGMKLQTDPTVIYGMGERFKGNISRRDLQRDTPYNTYIHAGLTPTPICMPGRAAIHAVLHPAPGKNLYFVAKGDGSHQFSPTLEAHNRAVRKYQLKRRN